jgi:hypothetical protein
VLAAYMPDARETVLVLVSARGINDDDTIRLEAAALQHMLEISAMLRRDAGNVAGMHMQEQRSRFPCLAQVIERVDESAQAIEIHDGFAIPRGGEHVANRDHLVGVEPRIRAARGPEGGGMAGDMERPGRHRDPRLEYALKPDRAETTFDRTVCAAGLSAPWLLRIAQYGWRFLGASGPQICLDAATELRADRRGPHDRRQPPLP